MIDIGWVAVIIGVFILFGWSVIIIAIGKPYWKKWMDDLNE